jgi:hypothetical protein
MSKVVSDAWEVAVIRGSAALVAVCLTPNGALPAEVTTVPGFAA